MSVIDQTLDHNGQSIHRIMSLYGAPDFVKSARIQDLRGPENMEPHLFADVTRRKFPVHNASATWMSAAFFHEKKGELDPALANVIGQRIADSARYFKITGDVNELISAVEKTSEVDESKLPDDVFAIIFGEGPDRERRLPLRNAMEVKQAAAWLCKYRDDLVFEDRRQIADKVMEHAVKFGSDISAERGELEKMAGLGACSAKDAVALIRTRVNAVGHTHAPNDLQEELTKLANMIEEHPSKLHHFGPLTKLASVLDQFDREHGLTVAYDTTLERPEDVLFCVTEKVAAELSNDLVGNTLTGNYYKRADLQRIPLSSYGDSLGQDFIDAVSTAGAWADGEKLARIVPTLPLGDAELFDAVAAEAGVPPFATKSAAAVRVPTADQCQLAAQHSPAPGSLWAQIR